MSQATHGEIVAAVAALVAQALPEAEVLTREVAEPETGLRAICRRGRIGPETAGAFNTDTAGEVWRRYNVDVHLEVPWKDSQADYDLLDEAVEALRQIIDGDGGAPGYRDLTISGKDRPQDGQFEGAGAQDWLRYGGQRGDCLRTVVTLSWRV